MNNHYIKGKDSTSFNIAFLYDHIEPDTLYILKNPTKEDLEEINEYDGYYFEYFLYNVNYNSILQIDRDDESLSVFQFDEQFKTIDDVLHAIYQEIIKNKDLNITTNITKLISTFNLENSDNYHEVYMYWIFKEYLNYKTGEYEHDKYHFVDKFEASLKTEKAFKTYIIKKFKDTYIDCDSARGSTLLNLHDEKDVVDSNKSKIVYVKNLSEYIELNKQLKRKSKRYKDGFQGYIEELQTYNKIMSKLSEAVKEYLNKNLL